MSVEIPPVGEFPEHGPGFRSGFVPLIGRSNVGKSTLLNRLVGQKVSIVSPVSQTTRNRIQAILTVPGRGQVVFLDTPGIHKPQYRMNRRMVALALESLEGTDLVLFMIDAAAGRGPGDDFVLERLREVSVPVLLLLNKIDRIRKEKLLPLIDGFRDEERFAHIIPLSAVDGTQCDVLLERVLELLPEGPPLFPADSLTDRPERFLAAEIVREQLLLRTREEVPHALAVRIESYREDPGIVHIDAAILVERESHKGIVIGRGGSMLKEAGTAARLELERLLATRVFLRLFVQVERGWRQDARILDDLGLRGPDR